MKRYYIHNVIIYGIPFKCDQPLGLEIAVKLARKFISGGYSFHVDEKISENRYKHVTVNELEQRLKTQQTQGHHPA